MECSALVIMSRTMEELDLVFNDILHVILERDHTKAQPALTYLSASKSKKERELEDAIEKAEREDLFREIEEEFYDLHKSSKTVYENSKFYERYWRKLMFVKDTIDDDLTLKITNKYYAVTENCDFSSYFVKTVLSYAPLCTGILLHLVDDSISRVSNAYSEAHARVYQENVLKAEKNNSIGEAIREIMKYSRRLVSEHKLNINAKSSIRIQQKPLYPEAASNLFEMEKWGRKRKDIEALKVKKHKYSVYTSREIINVADKIRDVTEKKDMKADNMHIAPEKKIISQFNKQTKNKNFKTKVKSLPNKLRIKGFYRDQSAKEIFENETLNSKNNDFKDEDAEMINCNEQHELLNLKKNSQGDDSSIVRDRKVVDNIRENSTVTYATSQSNYVKIGIYKCKPNVSLLH